ncbi:MAG: M23 family metallopeptidase [Patescibacteria group bacterium]
MNLNQIITKKNLYLAIIVKVIIALAIFGLSAFIIEEVEAASSLDLSYKQVKTADSPVVYYLDHARGLKKAYNNEASYLSYGNTWGEIKIISQDELNEWPDVYLVKTKENPAVYNIFQGKKKLILNENQFIGLGFNWEDIMVISQTDLDSYTLSEERFGGGPDKSTYEDEVSISLDSNSPAARQIPINTSDNLVAIFNFKGERGQTEILDLHLKLNGIMNPKFFNGVYLQEINNDKIIARASFSDRDFYFRFSADPIILMPGEVKKLGVYANIKNDNQAISQLFYFSIDEYNFISTDSWVEGNFPIKSNTMTLVNGSEVLGQVEAEQLAAIENNNQAIIGYENKMIAKVKISEISEKENIFLNKIVLENIGTAYGDQFNNFILKNDRGDIVSKISQLNKDSEIIFKLNNYQIAKGETESFTVYADINSGEDETIKLKLTQVKAVGQMQGFGLGANINSLEEMFIIKREMIGVINLPLTASKNVYKNQDGTIIGVFEIRSDNINVNLKTIKLNIIKSAEVPKIKEMLYLVNYNTGEIIDSLEAKELNQGSVYFDLYNYNLKPKNKITIAIIGEIPAEARSGDTYQVLFEEALYKTNNSYNYTDTLNISGQKLVVSKSNLYIYRNNEAKDALYIAGQPKVQIASFNLEAAAGEDIRISNITLANGENSGAITYDNGFSNIKLYIGGRNVGTISQPYTSTFTFPKFNYRLKENSRIELKVYADLASSVNTSQIQIKIAQIVAYGYSSGVRANINGLNTDSFQVTIGQLKAELIPIAGGNIAINQEENLVASFKIKNLGDEDLKLRYITLNTDNDGFTYSLGYKNLKIKQREKDKVVSNRISKPLAGANKFKLNYIIEVGKEAVFDVYVDTTEDAVIENNNIYFTNLIAEGRYSKISAYIIGDPRAGVNTSGNINNNNNNKTNLIKPVNGSITYYFYDPDYPFAGEHTGIDIQTAAGTSVKAAADGKLIKVVEPEVGKYSYLEIQHDNNLTTIYGHLSEIKVQVGDNVTAGQIIGLSGGQPGTPGAGSNSNGPHLHFEVRLDNTPVDPLDYL